MFAKIDRQIPQQSPAIPYACQRTVSRVPTSRLGTTESKQTTFLRTRLTCILAKNASMLVSRFDNEKKL